MKDLYCFIEGLVDADVVARPAEDAAPEHFECGNILEPLGSDRWRCRACEQRGMVRLAGARDRMPRRWQKYPITSSFPPPPADPNHWQEYLHDCFPDALAGMPADDAPGYPISFNTAAQLLGDVQVRDVRGSTATIWLWEPWIDHYFAFETVDELIPGEPGILVFHDRKRGYQRLDGHMSPEERQNVREWKNRGQTH